MSFTLSVKRSHSPFTRMFVDGATSLAEVISYRFVSPVSNVRKAFFEADVEGAPSLADVQLSGAFGAMNDVSLLYVRQLNCFVMFISDCGPWPLVLVRMEGHVPQFA